MRKEVYVCDLCENIMETDRDNQTIRKLHNIGFTIEADKWGGKGVPNGDKHICSHCVTAIVEEANQ